MKNPQTTQHTKFEGLFCESQTTQVLFSALSLICRVGVWQVIQLSFRWFLQNCYNANFEDKHALLTSKESSKVYF